LLDVLISRNRGRRIHGKLLFEEETYLY
jgi:hypothetical protein